MKKILFIALFIILADKIFSTNFKDSLKNRFLAIPVVFYSPDTRFAFGVGGNYNFLWSKKKFYFNKNQIKFGASYAQNKQILFYSGFQLLFNKQKQWCYGEIGYYLYRFPFYGIGQELKSKYLEKYDVRFPRIRVYALQKVSPHIFLGLRYALDAFSQFKFDPNGMLANLQTLGADSGASSSFGVSINYDTRDKRNYPYKGIFSEAFISFDQPFFGSDFQFGKVHCEFSHFKRMGEQLIFATNLLCEANIGTTPFHQLSTLGGPKYMRGYIDGRLRDKAIFSLQEEVRFPVWRWIKAAGFVSFGTAGDTVKKMLTKDWAISMGLGLRIQIDAQERSNIRLDYAIGRYSDGGFYLTFGEAF